MLLNVIDFVSLFLVRHRYHAPALRSGEIFCVWLYFVAAVILMVDLFANAEI